MTETDPCVPVVTTPFDAEWLEAHGAKAGCEYRGFTYIRKLNGATWFRSEGQPWRISEAHLIPTAVGELFDGADPTYGTKLIDGIDYGTIEAIWEQPCRDAHGNEFGGPPSFLDVYGCESITIEGTTKNLTYGYAIAHQHPTIVALVEHAKANRKLYENIVENGADGEALARYDNMACPSEAVAYALVALDFGPSYVSGYA